MPIVSVPIPEVAQSISRPIITDMISQVKAITGIKDDVYVLFPGDIMINPQPNSQLGSASRSPMLGNNRYISIEVEETYPKEALATNPVNQYEHLYIFKDPALGVYIKPVYTTTDIKIHLIYKTPSKTEAINWYNKMMMRVSQLADVNLHNITYHYGLPNNYLKLLKCIYDLREETDGYGDSFLTYLMSNASPKMTAIGDLAGNNNQYVITETQSRIVGIFDFDVIPDKVEKSSDSSTWTVAFDYKFSYEKPIGCSCRYPIMVHNQLLPKIYLEYLLQQYSLSNLHVARSASFSALQYFELQDKLEEYCSLHGYYRLPVFDEYKIEKPVNGTAPIFTALCSLDVIERKSLIYLNDMDGFFIDRDIMQFITESEYPYMTKLYKSIIQVYLYRNNNLANFNSITADSKSLIKLANPANLRIDHRVCFSLVYDLTLLDEDAIRRLLKYPRAMVKIILAINEQLRDNYAFILLGGKTRLTIYDFMKFFRYGPYDANDLVRGNRVPSSDRGGRYASDGSYKLDTAAVGTTLYPGGGYNADGSSNPNGRYDKDGNFCPPVAIPNNFINQQVIVDGLPALNPGLNQYLDTIRTDGKSINEILDSIVIDSHANSIIPGIFDNNPFIEYFRKLAIRHNTVATTYVIAMQHGQTYDPRLTPTQYVAAPVR